MALVNDSKVTFGFDLSFLAKGKIEEGPEKTYEKEETSKMMRKCLNELSLKYKEALTLFFLEDKSYEEISDILRIPIGTVGTRINRGKKLLKELCQKQM